ncbi:MAG: hypothetical protein PUC06_10690 [Oscillospiraceae bacterium]|nr:hypothetical protein [Oscillospiraceae bacterium]
MKKRNITRLMAATLSLMLLLTGCGEQAGSSPVEASAGTGAETEKPAETRAPLVETPQTTLAPVEQTGFGYVAGVSQLSVENGTPERLLLAGGTMYLDVVDEGGSHSLRNLDTMDKLDASLAGDVLAVCAAGDGFRYCVRKDSGLELVSVSKDGTISETVSLADSQNRYPLGLAVDGEGYAYLMLSDQVLVYNSTGKRVSALSLSAGEIASSIVCTEQGQVVLNVWSIQEDGSREGSVVLLNTESIGASLTEKRIAYQAYSGLGGTVLLSGGGNLYTLDVEQEAMEAILGWIDTAVNPDYVISVQPLSEDRIYFLSRTENGTELGVLKRVPASEIPERTTVSLGVGEISPELLQLLHSRAAEFNRNNADVRMRLVDYSVYADGNQRLMEDAAQLDLVLGAPDSLEQMELLSLDSLMDEEVGDNTLLPGLCSAVKTGESTRWLPVYFTVKTLAGNRQLVGEQEGWTPEEFSTAVEAHQELAVMRLSNCYDVLDALLSVADLDSDAFVSVLEAAAGIPVEDSAIYDLEANGDTSAVNALKNKTLLLEPVELRSFMELKALEKSVGEDLVLKGYPASTGNGAYLHVPAAVGISPGSRNANEAWQVLKVLLCENDSFLSQDGFGFPVLRADFDAMAEEAMKKVSFRDDSGNLVEQNPVIWLDEEAVEVEPFTDSEIDSFQTYLAGCSGIAGRSLGLKQAAREALKRILENGISPEEAARDLTTE